MWLSTLIALILVVMVIWLWQSNMRAKELAFESAKALCEAQDVQLFDQTVSLQKVRLKRLSGGYMAFWRLYEFDYGTDRSTRYRGRVIIHGPQVIDQSLHFQEGLSVLNRVNNLVPSPKTVHSQILEFKNLKKPANADSHSSHSTE